MEKEKIFDIVKIVLAVGLLAAGFATGIIWFHIAAYAIAGYETIIEAFSGIIHGEFLDENFLMTIASVGAIYCGEYPEAAAVMVFYSIGEFCEDMAVDNSRKSIAGLMDMKAEFANKLVDGKEITVSPEELAIGDIILVKPGEKVPVDGTVVTGASTLDTSALTGESLPRDIASGEEIFSGTVNLTGVITVKVTKAFEDSTVAKVLDLVENASEKKASVEKFITKFARFYTPIVVGVAVLLAVIPPVFIPGEVFNDWLYKAMIFLVISCPCALVISVPLTLFAGVGSASKQGILVKGSNYLEALAKLDTVVFDKTGTLTSGKFAVSAVNPFENAVSEDMLLEIGAYGESLSNHPIAKSIVNFYITNRAGKNAEENANALSGRSITDYSEISGKGISAKLDGKEIFCGNAKLMADLGLDIAAPSEMGSVVHVAEEGKYLGYIVVSDVVRSESATMISGLYEEGIKRTVMLTGDRKEIAASVAEKLGLTKALGELLPGDKVDALEAIMSEVGSPSSESGSATYTDSSDIPTSSDEKNKKGHLAYVGDGINDAPVLARADIGIAMGAFGSDAAIEAADVVIMTDDISRLNTVIKIAKKTIRIAKENVIFALAIKALIMALGAAGIATMWAAVFADVGVTFIAVLNAMRALKL